MAALPKAEFHPTTLLGNTDICRTKRGKKAHKHSQPHILCITIQDFYKDGCFVSLFCKTVPWARTRVWHTPLHTATSSPTSYSFKSLTFMLINTALAEEVHCEEGNSPHTPLTVPHEILPLPQQAPSKNIQVYHAKARTISGSPKRQSEVPPKNQSSFSKKGPPLGSLPIKPDHEAVFRGWIEFLLTQLMSAACSPPQGFQEQIGLHRHILSDFMHSEALRHKIPGSEGHCFFSLLSAYVLLKKKTKQKKKTTQANRSWNLYLGSQGPHPRSAGPYNLQAKPQICSMWIIQDDSFPWWVLSIRMREGKKQISADTI